MNELERKTGALQPRYELQPVSWRDVRQALSEQYLMEMRVETGKRMTIRSVHAIDEITEAMGTPNVFKNMLLTAFATGAAELINGYMTHE